MLKYNIIFCHPTHPTLTFLQLKSKPEVVQLPLYSLKHEQVQSLQEDEHPCQKQMSFRCYCCVTVIYPKLPDRVSGVLGISSSPIKQGKFHYNW